MRYHWRGIGASIFIITIPSINVWSPIKQFMPTNVNYSNQRLDYLGHLTGWRLAEKSAEISTRVIKLFYYGSYYDSVGIWKKECRKAFLEIAFCAPHLELEEVYLWWLGAFQKDKVEI